MTNGPYNSVKRMQRYIAYRERDKASMRKYTRSFRVRIFELLGHKCVCKGTDCWHKGECMVDDKRCLHVDHIKSGGNKQLDIIFKTNTEMYRYYLQRPIRARREVQILCANCNYVKKHVNKEGTLGDVYAKTTVSVDQPTVILPTATPANVPPETVTPPNVNTKN